MFYERLIFLAVFVPIIGAFIVPLASRISKGVRDLLSFFFILTSLFCSVLLLPWVFYLKAVSLSIPLSMGFNFLFTADALAVFMAISSSALSAIIVLYSFTYISHYENQNEYYCMVVLFLGSMTGIIFSGNLIFLYIFWELTAICSWRLIGFFRSKTDVLRADKAFLITFFGAAVMLIGFLYIYKETHSFDLPFIKQFFSTSAIPNIAVVLILFGILSKSAILPFQVWLPDAGVAPSPVTALLHAAVLVKIGVYVFARFFVMTINLSDVWHVALPWIALASSLISAGAALVDTDIKRIIAYSTISQIGFIFFGLATGNSFSIAGGILYILMHGLAKAGLFLCAGIIEQNTHTKDITKLGGLIKTMPLTAVAFLFCAFSVMGIPPFGGFFSKYMVLAGGIKANQLLVTFLFLFAAVFTIVYLFRLFQAVFLGNLQIEAREKESYPMVFCVMLLGILSLLGGIFVNYPLRLIELIH